MKVVHSIKRYIGNLNLNKKLSLAMVFLLVFISLFNLLIFTAYAQQTLKTKAVQLTSQQLEVAQYNTQNTLDNLYNMAQETIHNSWVQSFLRTKKGYSDSYTLYERSTNEVLDNQLFANNNLHFLSLFKYNDNQMLYTGPVWTIPSVRTELQTIYQSSQPLGVGTMRYSLQKDIFNQEAYSHYFFMPVYNLFRLDEEIGLLAIGIRESDLRSVYSASTDENLSLYLTNENGKILSDPSYKNILTDSILADNTLYSQGELDGKNNQSLILYHQLSSPGWYMVGEISTNDLLKDSAALITVFISILIVGIGAGLVFIYFITRNLYRPVSELVKRIGQVSDGNLQVQIAENNFGQDFKHLLSSFNNMVQQIRLLIEQVKEEQRQVDKIKLNMLQSQIQPHFLYNVLDSIHWQAAYNKDKEVSNMLHTLASYYRLSLSKGSDVIPLRQELAMVKDYLTLQNMRYDNLVELDISVEDRWMELPIPKLTLQPLVENAIYHGFRSVSQKHGRLRISSKLINNDVLLIVEDDGKGISTEQALKLNKAIMEYDEDAGYGLRNVQKRFEIYFGAEYGLHITPNDTGGTSIYVFLPSSNLSQDIM